MLFTIFSVFYVLVAAAMIVLILMQRGDGANAGASFGGGASGTVFGARGAASFLTRTTAALASIFFLLSLGMGIYLSHNGVKPNVQQTLGVMAGGGSSAPASSVPASAPAASAPASSVPAQQSEVPAAAPSSAQSEVPAAPKTSASASSVPASSGPAGSH
ncbi:MAG TPA: preprotein translocase subunit SecG [Rhodanobacteraceae bacterium]|nr:preprotein translocase subunit SecG [Rhodanobacteraceae bacterium]